MKKLVVVAVTLLVTCATMFANGSQDSGKKKVFLITMDQMDQHWVQVNKGAQDAAKEAGTIQYKWLAPDTKDDAKQIECINNALSEGANCILLAANGPDAVTSALKEATAAGVKIVYVDSAADYPGEQLLATDNRAGGLQVGQMLIKALTAKNITRGKIGIIGVNAATESCNQREFGFRDAFKGTNFTLLETQYCQGDASVAKDMAANFITEGCVAVYGANEGSTVGVGNAVKEAKDKNVIGCGSDASDMNKSLVKSGALLCIMAQNPYKMGYEGIKSAVKVLAGEKLSPAYFDTGVSIITKSDL